MFGRLFFPLLCCHCNDNLAVEIDYGSSLGTRLTAQLPEEDYQSIIEMLQIKILPATVKSKIYRQHRSLTSLYLPVPYSDGDRSPTGNIRRAEGDGVPQHQLPQIQTGYSCCSPVAMHPSPR